MRSRRPARSRRCRSRCRTGPARRLPARALGGAEELGRAVAAHDPAGGVARDPDLVARGLQRRERAARRARPTVRECADALDVPVLAGPDRRGGVAGDELRRVLEPLACRRGGLLVADAEPGDERAATARTSGSASGERAAAVAGARAAGAASAVTAARRSAQDGSVESRSCGAFQGRAQRRQRAVDARAGGGGGDREAVADLVVGALVDDAQLDRAAVARAQIGQSAGRAAERAARRRAAPPPRRRRLRRSRGPACRSAPARCGRAMPRRACIAAWLRAMAKSHGPADPSRSSLKRLRTVHAAANVSASRSAATSPSRVRWRRKARSAGP